MRTALALSLLLFSACSGSGSSSGTTSVSTPPSLPLVVDTQAESTSETLLRGTATAVVLEDEAGVFTPSLVTAPQELVFTDPSGASSAIPLGAVPPGTYVAAHVVLEPGSLEAVLSDGQLQPVVLTEPRIEIRFEPPVELPLSAGGWLVIRHANEPTYTAGPGGEIVWQPELEGRIEDLQPLSDTVAEIVSVARGDLAATATLPAWNGAVVDLHFESAAHLMLDDEQVTPTDFVGSLQPGQLIWIEEALVQRTDRVWVLAASDAARSAAMPGRGNKNDVSGVIRSLQRNQTFDLRVRRIHKAGFGFPGGRPLDLRVLVDADTKIKWTPRLGRHSGHLPFQALRPGMRVEVEWLGTPVRRTVTAHKVNIVGVARGLRRSLVGTVGTIDLVNDEFVLEPRARATGFGRHPFLIAELEPDSILVRQTRDGIEVIELGDLREGEAIWLLAERLRDNRIRATLALVVGR